MATKTKKFHYCWVILLSCCVIGFCTLATVANCMGTFMPSVVQALGIKNTQFSLYYTFLNFTLMFGQPLAQKCMKKFDIRICMSVAVTLSALAVALMSVYTSITGWYLSAILNGLGLSFICYLLFPIVLGNWFKKGYGTVFGIASSMSGLGGALWTANVGRWIAALGYQKAYLICAGIAWIVAMPFCIFGLRTRPEEKGLKPYGADEAETVVADKPAEVEARGFTMKEAIRTPYFWMMLLSVLCIHFMGTFQNQITNFAASVGFPIEQASVVASCLLVGAVVGKIGLGWIHDHFGIRATWCTAIIGLLAALALLLFGGATPIIVFIGGFVFGCGYGLMGIGSPLLIRATLGTKDYATIFSYVISLGTLVNAFAPLVYSGIYDKTGSYYGGLYICAGALILSLLLANILISRTKRLWNKDAK